MRHDNSPPIMRSELWGLMGKSLSLLLGVWIWVSFPAVWMIGAFMVVVFGLGILFSLYAVAVARSHVNQQRRWEYGATVHITGKTSGLATFNDLVIHKMNGRNGAIVGALSKQLLCYDFWARGHGSGVVLGPSRTGKTTCNVIPTLLNPDYSYSVFVNDMKGEIAHVTLPVRLWAGHRCVCLNPCDIPGLPNHKLNPLQPLIYDIQQNGGREAHELADIIAQTMIPEPERGPGENLVFRAGGRRLIITFLLYLAVFQPEDCHPVMLRELVWASIERMEMIAHRMKHSDELRGLIKSYGNQLANMLDRSFRKTFGSFQTEALEAVKIYDPSSEWTNSLKTCDITFQDMQQEGVTVYLNMPEAKQTTHGQYNALVTTMYIETVSRMHTRSKRLMLLDEAGNMGAIPQSTLKRALSALPAKGLRLYTFWQSPAQMRMLYGDDMAKLIMDQSSLVQAWSIRDVELAELWSRMSGKTTVKNPSFSKDPFDRDYNWRLQMGEKEEPVLNETEILQMSDEQQLVWVAGQPMIKCRRIPFWKVALWRKIARSNPCEPAGYPKEDVVEWQY